jgi:flagellar biosynthetic protein FliO
MMNLMLLLKKWFETASRKQKLTVALLVFSLFSTVVLFAMNGSSKTATDPLESTPFYFVGVFLKLIGVLLLIVASSVIFRRWFQPGFNGKSTRQLHLLETVRLSPKQALHLVSIGDQQLLIGATDQNVSLITQVEPGMIPTETDSIEVKPASDFGSFLQVFTHQSSSESSKS